MSIFIPGNFKLHSGDESLWKIECDNLTEQDLAVLAEMIDDQLIGSWGEVYGVPQGGLRFAEHLRYYSVPNRRPLIVDDVLTTGKSMEAMKEKLGVSNVRGLVIFSRGLCPDWVTPIFQLHASFS